MPPNPSRSPAGATFRSRAEKCSAARARRNFRVVTGAHAQSLLFEGTRCVGVCYSVQGETFEARAAREVIVSAGSIASPQLLELSGIGQAERLKSLGITVVHELPGVG